MSSAPNDRYRFEAARDALFQMESLLKARGVEIGVGSLLEAAAFATLRIEQRQTHPSNDVRIEMAQMVGVAELGHQLHKNQHDPKFDQLVPHLRLLSDPAAAVLQLGTSSVIDQARNKIFELLVACWVLPLASAIEMDDPTTSAGGTNPDIIATINGQRWGIACKVMHSRTPQQLLATVEKGVLQIEASTADRGFVVVNMKNLLEVDTYWPRLDSRDRMTNDPEFVAFEDGVPFAMLREQLAGFVMDAKRAAGQAEFERILVRPRIVPAIAMWGHALSPVLLDSEPVATSVRSLLVATVSDQPGKEISPADRALLERLNDNAMTIAGP